MVASFAHTAIQELEQQLSSAAASAGLVRAPEGTFLVAVAQTTSRAQLVVASVDAPGTWSVQQETEWEKCLRAPKIGGVCEAGIQ